jgi:hypothetical protein
MLTVSGTETASSAIARGGLINTTLVASANNDVLVGLDIAPTFTNGAFTGVTNAAIRVGGNIINNSGYSYSIGTSGNPFASVFAVNFFSPANINLVGSQNAFISAGSTTALGIFQSSRNVLIQNGGTFTDAGFRLDVNGTARVQGNFKVGIGGGSTDAILQVSNASNFGAILKVSDTNSNATGTILFGDGNSTSGNVGIWRGAANSLTTAGNCLNLGSFTDMIFAVSATSIGSQSERMRITSSGGNVLIGTSTDVASSKLTVTSTTQGFLPPRMTTTEKNAISSPATGLVVFDTTLGKLCVFAGTWQTITSV